MLLRSASYASSTEFPSQVWCKTVSAFCSSELTEHNVLLTSPSTHRCGPSLVICYAWMESEWNVQPRHIVQQLFKDIVPRPDMSTHISTFYNGRIKDVHIPFFPLTMDLSRHPIKNGTVSSICSAFKNLIYTCMHIGIRLLRKWLISSFSYILLSIFCVGPFVSSSSCQWVVSPTSYCKLQLLLCWLRH